MAEEVLVCPFCGAPHSESIPAGVVQVKCHYCGAEVLVPPRLGGAIQRCPNHPEVSALGLCNDLVKAFVINVCSARYFENSVNVKRLIDQISKLKRSC